MAVKNDPLLRGVNGVDANKLGIDDQLQAPEPPKDAHKVRTRIAEPEAIVVGPKTKQSVRGPEGRRMKSTGGARAGATVATSPAVLAQKLSEPIEIKILPGMRVNEAIEELIDLANKTGKPHSADFNGFLLVANPGDSESTLRAAFDKHMDEVSARVAKLRAEEARLRAEKLSKIPKIIDEPPEARV